MSKLKQIVLVYCTILLTYLFADFIWLGLISKNEYTDSIGHLVRESSIIWPWVTFYVIYAACILRLAIFNGSTPSFSRVTVNALVLGLASYGAYNLTNYAILETWPLQISLKDWAWGVSVTTLSGISGFICLKYTQKVVVNQSPTNELEPVNDRR